MLASSAGRPGSPPMRARWATGDAPRSHRDRAQRGEARRSARHHDTGRDDRHDGALLIEDALRPASRDRRSAGRSPARRASTACAPACRRPGGRRQDRQREQRGRQRRGHRLAARPGADPDRGLLHEIDDPGRGPQHGHRRCGPSGRRWSRLDGFPVRWNRVRFHLTGRRVPPRMRLLEDLAFVCGHDVRVHRHDNFA